MRFYWPIAKVDGEQQMVWGYASTEAEDDQGETVTRAALTAALDDYMRFANIREMHRPSAVGVATEAAVDDKGLYLGARIVDADAWRKVAEGVYKGFSIGGRVTARDPADRRLITGLRLTEISVVDRPANPEAVFDCWKLSGASDAVHPAEAAGGDGYADPGYQPDGRPRYPIGSEPHIRAAWSYIHQADNERRYTPVQLAQVKARIAAAWRATIDSAGPPAAASPESTARKGLGAVAFLAQLVVELEDLADGLAGETDASQLRLRLRDITARLCDALAALTAEEGGESELAALAAAGPLRRAAPATDVTALTSGLAKLAGEIVPRLDALQQRVDAIARTPLPPQTAARGFAGLAKRDDADAALAAPGDVVAALARMSDDERTLTLIKAAHARPIRPAIR